MAQRAYSARGEVVDFEVLKIKQQLALTPTTTEVTARRAYIDEKAGILKKETNSTIESEVLAQIAKDIKKQAIEVKEPEPENNEELSNIEEK